MIMNLKKHHIAARASRRQTFDVISQNVSTSSLPVRSFGRTKYLRSAPRSVYPDVLDQADRRPSPQERQHDPLRSPRLRAPGWSTPGSRAVAVLSVR